MVIDYQILIQFYENNAWTDFPGGITAGSMHLDRAIVKGEIAFGVMYASKFEVEIYNVEENYSGKRIRVVKRKDGVADKYLFTGRVESSDTDYTGVFRDIVAYDDFYDKRSLNVAGWWNNLWMHAEGVTVTKTLAELFTGVCSYAGIMVSSGTSSNLSSLPNATMTMTDAEIEQYSKITFEDVIHSICELMGVFPSINGNGELELIKLGTGTPTSISDDSVEIANSHYEDYETDYINRIDVYLSSDDLYLSVGQGNNGYPVSGNLFLLAKEDTAIRTISTSLLNAIGSIKYVPCSLKLIVADIGLAIGERFSVENNTSYAFGLVYSGVQLIEQSVNCDAHGQSITQKVNGVNNERVLRSGVSNVVTKTGSVTIFEVNNIVDEAVSSATQLITGGQGSYVFLIKDNNGYITEICFADQPGVDALGHPTASNVWRWNSGGLGFSSTGYNGQFGTAITNDGKIVADYITAGTLNANIFNASSIYVNPNGTGNTVADELSDISSDLDDAVTNLQNQIDGVIETFSGIVAPTMSNYPVNTWSVSDYAAHVGDLFVGDVGSPIEGFWYRFQYDNFTQTYSWVHLRDNEIQKAIQDAADAMDVAEAAYDAASDAAQDASDAVATANQSLSRADIYFFKSTSPTSLIAAEITADWSGDWQSDAPVWTSGAYIWQKTMFTPHVGSVYWSYPVCISGSTGDSANVQYLLSSTNEIICDNTGWFNPSSITFSSYSKSGVSDPVSYSGRFVVVGYTFGGDEIPIYTSRHDESEILITNSVDNILVINTSDGDFYVDNDELVITRGAALSGTELVIDPSDQISIEQQYLLELVKYIKCYLYRSGGTSVLLDQQTVAVLYDGDQGLPGQDGCTVLLSNENHTFAGNMTSAVDGSTDCYVIAYRGTTRLVCSIGTITGQPTGMTTTISDNGTTSAKFTVSVTTSMVTKNGTLTIPVTVDGKSFNLTFTYSLALAGKNFNWNLWRSTQHYDNWVNSNDLVTFEADSPTDDIVISDGSLLWATGEQRMWAHPYSEIRNQTVTLSFWVKGNAIASEQSYFIIDIDLYNEISSSMSRVKYRNQPLYFTLTNEWQLVTWVQEITDSYFTSGTGTPNFNSCYYRLVLTNNVSSPCTNTAPYKVRELKLEVGSTATAWAPRAEESVGIGISSIRELYYCSASSTVPNAPTDVSQVASTQVYEQWTSEVPVWTEQYQYYYTCSEIHYDDNSISWSTPVGNSAYNQANQVANDASDAANEAQNTADLAMDTAGQAQEAANAASGAVTELNGQVSDLNGQLSSLESLMAALEASAADYQNSLMALNAKFTALQNDVVFQSFYVVEDGVHISFEKDNDKGEIIMDGANIRFYINGSERSLINAEGFNFDYGIITTALQIGKSGDGTDTNATWTWTKAQSGNFRLVYKGA